MIYDKYPGKLTGDYQDFDGVRAIHVTVLSNITQFHSQRKESGRRHSLVTSSGNSQHPGSQMPVRY